jgi:dihydrofolate reductase
MRGLIWAQSADGVIGAGGTIPWHYRGDLKRFKRVTMGSTIVMGRATFESMGRRPLPGRQNVVVTRAAIDVPGVEVVRSLDEAMALAGAADVWFIGGARVYEEAMKWADVIDVAYVPDVIDAPDAVRAPPIDERLFEASPLEPHEDEPTLMRRVFRRRPTST